MMTITTTLTNPVNGGKEELHIGTAKPIDEFIMAKYFKNVKSFDDLKNQFMQRGFSMLLQ